MYLQENNICFWYQLYLLTAWFVCSEWTDYHSSWKLSQSLESIQLIFVNMQLLVWNHKTSRFAFYDLCNALLQMLCYFFLINFVYFLGLSRGVDWWVTITITKVGPRYCTRVGQPSPLATAVRRCTNVQLHRSYTQYKTVQVHVQVSVGL